MIKKSYFPYLLSLAAAVFLSISCDTGNSTEQNVETGEFKAIISFEGPAGISRAAGSTAIPQTSWSNIKNAQVFLIEDGIVKYSKQIEVPASGIYEQTWPNVPIGTYTVSLVANVDSSSDDIVTSLDGGTTFDKWEDYNVRQKRLSDLTMYLKQGEFPAHAKSTYEGLGKTPKTSPSEIFMGSTQNITVNTGQTSYATLTIQREVAMMRVRLNQVPGSDADGVNFLHADASIMYHRIPRGMTILSGTTGGVTTGASDADATVVVHTGADTFKTTDENYGVAGKTIIDSDYTMWRDIIVLPNSADRNTPTLTANREYTIVISGRANAGHKLASGEILTNPATVYWSGRIPDSFYPNKIREVNIDVKTGGSTTPPDIREEGSLDITISAPLEWNSNIDVTTIEM